MKLIVAKVLKYVKHDQQARSQPDGQTCDVDQCIIPLTEKDPGEGVVVIFEYNEDTKILVTWSRGRCARGHLAISLL